IGELEILPESIAVESLVEAQCLEHLAPIGHVAPGEALDLHPRAGRERMVGTSRPLHDPSPVGVEEEEPAGESSEQPLARGRIRTLRAAHTADLAAAVVLEGAR